MPWNTYTAAGNLKTAAQASPITVYRKATVKTVNTSVAETDLLNGEITIAASTLAATGVMRLFASGDFLQNSGAATDIFRLKLILGGTTLIDTGVTGTTVHANGATRGVWFVDATIQAANATNSQVVYYKSEFTNGVSGTAGGSALTTGAGRNRGYGSETVFTNGWNSAAVDMTAARTLTLTTINPSASASCEIVLKSANIQIV